jgi:hypothetical protein
LISKDFWLNFAQKIDLGAVLSGQNRLFKLMIVTLFILWLSRRLGQSAAANQSTVLMPDVSLIGGWDPIVQQYFLPRRTEAE